MHTELTCEKSVLILKVRSVTVFKKSTFYIHFGVLSFTTDSSCMFVSDESQRDGAQSSSSYSTVPDGSGESPSQKNGNSSCSDNVKKAAQQVN